MSPPGGEHFLFVSDASTGEIQLAQNWFEELKRLLPED
jgi:hypothetical protein